MRRRAGAEQACGPAPDTPRPLPRADGHPARRVCRGTSVEDVPPRGVPRAPFPHAAEDGPVSTRPVGVGVGEKEHGTSRYRGTARQLIP